MPVSIPRPTMIIDVHIPEDFIDWAAEQMHERGYDVLDPVLIAFIFQEAVDRALGRSMTVRDIAVMIGAAIANYELTLELEERMRAADDGAVE